MTFLELYDTIQETTDVFYIGKIHVRLVEISDDIYNLSEASERVPGNMASLGKAANPNAFDKMTGKEVSGKVSPHVSPEMTGEHPSYSQLKKFRATYSINGEEITNYLTAMNKNEAKRMLFDYLEKLGNTKQRTSIVNSSDIAPVDDWKELIRLLRYSMKWDHKKSGNKRTTFSSIDNADYHLMLSLVQKHPDFVKSHLIGLPDDIQRYFKIVYNGLSKRNLDSDLAKTKEGSFWGNKIKDMTGNYGKDIAKKLAGVKAYNKPEEEPSKPQITHYAPNLFLQQGSPDRGSLGDDDSNPSTLYGAPPVPTEPYRQKTRI